jgi:hypothetical protein
MSSAGVVRMDKGMRYGPGQFLKISRTEKSHPFFALYLALALVCYESNKHN